MRRARCLTARGCSKSEAVPAGLAEIVAGVPFVSGSAQTKSIDGCSPEPMVVSSRV
jgi:hypothetical protein